MLSLPFRSQNLATEVEKPAKVDIKLALSSFSGFLYFVLDILPKIV